LTFVDELVVRDMVSSYNHANQYVKLKGRQIDMGEEGVEIFLGLSHEGVVPIGKESYNPIVATYFIGDEHEHYIPHSRYLIAKGDDKQKVARLEALMGEIIVK
jgi:hypothetical protein